MKLNVQLQGIKLVDASVADVNITVEYTVDELRTLTLSYEKMIPMFGDIILKADPSG